MKWIAVFLCVFLNAEIIEFSRFERLPEYVDENTLLLVDIDDTLLIPKQMLGCDEWFQHRLKVHKKSDYKKALELALAEFEAVRHLTQMEIVEPGSEKILEKLQKKSICLMGLTTQGLALATRTSQQLLQQQIDLSITAPSKKDHYFLVGDHGVLFRNGILFTSGTDKGQALFQFCEAAGFVPKRIVFINDKGTHLLEIEREALKRKIPFIGLRYSYSDAKKKQFQPEIAHYQFTHSSLDRLLSDQEALQQVGIE